MDYDKLVEIDRGDLEESWLVQAPRYMQLVRAEAEAKKQVSEIKEKQDTITATRAKQVRSEADAAGTKLTEVALAQTLTIDAEVLAAKAEVRNAEYQKDMVSGARIALEHRKYALQDLVQLDLRNNRAEPAFKGAVKEEVEQVFTRNRQQAHPIQAPRRK